MLADWIGNKITIYRKVKKMTQEELGLHIGLSRASIVNIEKGKQNASIDVIWKIATALKITPDKLLPLQNEHITVQTNSTEKDLREQLSSDDADEILKWIDKM